MGLLTKVSFPQCLFSPVGHRSRATRNTRKMLCTLSAAKHDQAGSACWRCCIFESLLFELLEARERGRPPQAALSLIQVPGGFQNHVAGEQREGALTDAVTSQFSGPGATSSPANDQAPWTFSPSNSSPIFGIGKFSSRSRHRRPFSSLTGALRGGWGFPPCLVAFLASIGYFRTTDVPSTSLDSRF